MTDQPETTDPSPETGPATATDDGGEALERSAESIHEARDAEGQVAAHDDITALDAARAGEHTEDPGGEGGHP